MRHRQGRLKNQKGQVIIENVLLMVVMIGVFTLIIQSLTKSNFVTAFTDGPWEMMDGMIQCGTWAPCKVGKPITNGHPNTSGRVLSLDPNAVSL